MVGFGRHRRIIASGARFPTLVNSSSSPPSSRGPGRHPFKVEIAGSNPAGGTTGPACSDPSGRGAVSGSTGPASRARSPPRRSRARRRPRSRRRSPRPRSGRQRPGAPRESPPRGPPARDRRRRSPRSPAPEREHRDLGRVADLDRVDDVGDRPDQGEREEDARRRDRDRADVGTAPPCAAPAGSCRPPDRHVLDPVGRRDRRPGAWTGAGPRTRDPAPDPAAGAP